MCPPVGLSVRQSLRPSVSLSVPLLLKIPEMEIFQYKGRSVNSSVRRMVDLLAHWLVSPCSLIGWSLILAPQCLVDPRVFPFPEIMKLWILLAAKRLYRSQYQSVGRSVGLPVCRSTRSDVYRSFGLVYFPLTQLRMHCLPLDLVFNCLKNNS